MLILHWCTWVENIRRGFPKFLRRVHVFWKKFKGRVHSFVFYWHIFWVLCWGVLWYTPPPTPPCVFREKNSLQSCAIFDFLKLLKTIITRIAKTSLFAFTFEGQQQKVKIQIYIFLSFLFQLYFLFLDFNTFSNIYRPKIHKNV